MHVLRDIWDRLTPREPGPAFLFGFLAAALAIFALGFWIGQP